MSASIFEKDLRLRLSRDGLAAWTWLRSIGIAAAVGVSYFLAAQLSNSFLITPETVIFWPAAGISAGLLISLWSTARWPVLTGVIVATAAANLLRHLSVAATAAWVLGNAAEPLIIAGLMQHYFGAHFKIDRLYCILGLFAAAAAGTAVASTWWTFVYYWLFASLKEPTATWLHWIVSDFAGIVSVAPLVIGLAAALQRPPPRREAIESIAALAVLGAMTGIIVFSLPAEAWETVVPAALVFPMLLWLAARSQPVFAAAGAFIVSITVALTAIYGLGHFGGTGLSIGVRILQTEAIILVVGFGTAVLAALFAERRESDARLAQSNALLQRERDNKLLNAQSIVATRAVLESLSNELTDHHIESRSEMTSELPQVHGNRSQLQEVVSNLIVNAIEAMETTSIRNRVLHVRTELCDDKAIAVVVEDSGPGIDEDKLGSIFTPFATTKGHGKGLGLAISRKIVEHHGGKLTASSDHKGGASFQFILPTVSIDKDGARAKLAAGS
jgi:signal transduction histidine kinase